MRWCWQRFLLAISLSTDAANFWISCDFCKILVIYLWVFCIDYQKMILHILSSIVPLRSSSYPLNAWLRGILEVISAPWYLYLNVKIKSVQTNHYSPTHHFFHLFVFIQKNKQYTNVCWKRNVLSNITICFLCTYPFLSPDAKRRERSLTPMLTNILCLSVCFMLYIYSVYIHLYVGIILGNRTKDSYPRVNYK